MPRSTAVAYEDGKAVVGVFDLQLDVAVEDVLEEEGGVELEDADLGVDEELIFAPVLRTDLLQTRRRTIELIKNDSMKL